MNRITLKAVISIATLSVALPAFAAPLGNAGAVHMGAAAGDAATMHAGMTGMDHAMGAASASGPAAGHAAVAGAAGSDNPVRASADSAAGMTGHMGANEHTSLTGRVESRIKSNDRLKGMDIKTVISKDGVVTLSGAVKSRAQKKFAENLVASISGVTSVNSNLKVQAR